MKLSGGAFAGEEEFGFDRGALDHIGSELSDLIRSGVETAVMVGGGNIFRGRTADQWGIERAEADNIGTMATVVNSLILRGVLTAKAVEDVRVMTAIPMPAVAEPYIRLRAIHHLEKGHLVIFAGGTGQPYVTTDYPAVQRALEIRAEAILVAKRGVNGVFTTDPKKDPAARRYRSVDYDTVLRTDVQVMDQSAFILARDYGLPIYVFDFTQERCLSRIIAGENVGTVIAPDVPVEIE
ncbi:MAG: UMP kinase [Thermaerobacter sp.]|nr:UMP kinase [Thermaerobacter sp.]